jgi:pyruvate/2-oxoglutarate dehydrogenase complex dihydrolipoamide dehydrogenase (E3) component
MPDNPIPNPIDQNDRRLLDNVHPETWINPVPAPRYNLVVIGAGTAGLVTAAGAAGLGAKVAIVERSLFGGDCLNTGCVPSKVLIRSARSIHALRTGAQYGAYASDISFDFTKAMERMRRLRADISIHDSLARFSRELKVDVFLGQARFLGRDSVDVNGVPLRFKKAAICTGSRPSVPPVPGLGEAAYLTNETVFQLTELPKRLAVIGGGPIGCELAQAFARMGSRVALFERGGQLLPRDDADAAGLVRDSLERDGVTVRLRSSVTAVESLRGEKRLTFESGGEREEMAADGVLVATGRISNVEGLDLEKAGAALDPQAGVIVNTRLQTANPDIYAAGDVCSPFRFTHAADAMARIVIANALFPGRQKVSDLVMPWCTYTDPEVAHVGMYEQEASGRGINVTTLTVPLSDVDRAVLDGDAEGFARVHLKKGTDRILGATIVARNAGDMISEITLAMTSGAGLSSIGRTIHPYPTQSEAVRKLADRYNKTRLTPIVKRLLNAWFRLRRTY